MLNKLLEILNDIQAFDIKAIDVRKQTTITDYMVIVSGRSSRHVRAIADKVIEDMKLAGINVLHAAGFESSEWILIDFGDVILHIMQPESRNYYNLEELWQEK